MLPTHQAPGPFRRKIKSISSSVVAPTLPDPIPAIRCPFHGKTPGKIYFLTLVLSGAQVPSHSVTTTLTNCTGTSSLTTRCGAVSLLDMEVQGGSFHLGSLRIECSAHVWTLYHAAVHRDVGEEKPRLGASVLGSRDSAGKYPINHFRRVKRETQNVRMFRIRGAQKSLPLQIICRKYFDFEVPSQKKISGLAPQFDSSLALRVSLLPP
ncbi:Proenkephalin-A [Frankliniella fusca]|uniref:Proenkephalin-A n=1 Tax=Frankliniella fusca TaxID=407009 RepID=A0AAE1GT51_9NEOP|nr:Proenkephalin-A [Frankliniella fusca]